MCMLFNMIIFQYEWGSQRYLGIWVEILEFVGMLFIYLKVTSNKSAPELSIIHFCDMFVFDNICLENSNEEVILGITTDNKLTI